LQSGLKNILAGTLWLFAGLTLNAQVVFPDSLPSEQKGLKRIHYVAGLQLSGYAVALIALDQAWYKDYPRTSFHFHNDLPDWYQQDKLGHILNTYHLSRFSAASFRWAGIDNKQSAWLGVISGLGFLSAIEVLDGFSLEWGASLADAGANMLGAGAFVSQQLTWQEQRLIIKYSYSESSLAQFRPGLLGSSLPERMLKDYNGQTFWLSMNVRSFLKPESKFPPWLNLAIGHGAYGMLGSRQNPPFIDGVELPHMSRYRQWYLAPDIDFAKIPVSAPWLKSFLGALNFLKMPSPALEYNKEQGLRLHWIFF
jgi:hypothetical protein